MNTLTDVHLPLLPLDYVTIDLEANSFGLDDMKRLEIVTKLEPLGLCQEVREEVIRLLRRRETFPVGCGLSILFEGRVSSGVDS